MNKHYDSLQRALDQDVLVLKANALKALGHPTRLAIIEILSRGEQCVCRIMDELELEQAIVSKHLRILRDAGLVVARKEGLNIYYSLACACIIRLMEHVTRTIKSISELQRCVFEKS